VRRQKRKIKEKSKKTKVRKQMSEGSQKAEVRIEI